MLFGPLREFGDDFTQGVKSPVLHCGINPLVRVDLLTFKELVLWFSKAMDG